MNKENVYFAKIQISCTENIFFLKTQFLVELHEEKN